MHKFKKILSVLSIMLFSFGLIACKSSNNTNTQNSTVQASNDVSPEESKNILEKKYNTQYNAKNFLTSIKSNDIDKVTLFLKAGMDTKTKDLEDQDWYGKSALMIASGMGYKDMTLLLIKNGADVNAIDDKGRNALWTVIDKDKPEMIKLLADNKINLEYRDTKDNGNPLFYAVAENKTNCVKMLIDLGADVNVKREGSSLLHLVAYKNGDPTIIDILLEKRLDINIKDSLGMTPLKLAELKHNDEIIKKLKEKGAN